MPYEIEKQSDGLNRAYFAYLGSQVQVAVPRHGLGHARGDVVQCDVLAALVATDDHHHLAVERVGDAVRVGVQLLPSPLVHSCYSDD
jgi:hypothetical protein